MNAKEKHKEHCKRCNVELKFSNSYEIGYGKITDKDITKDDVFWYSIKSTSNLFCPDCYKLIISKVKK